MMYKTVAGSFSQWEDFAGSHITNNIVFHLADLIFIETALKKSCVKQIGLDCLTLVMVCSFFFSGHRCD